MKRLRRILWKLIGTTLHSTNTEIPYVINSEIGINEELEDEPRWKAYRRESNVDSELYFGYNLAKALKVCELDRCKL